MGWFLCKNNQNNADSMGSWVAKYQMLRNIHPTVVHSCAPKPLQLILMQLPLQALCLTYHTATQELERVQRVKGSNDTRDLQGALLV